jgi:hypothetical protein
MKIWEPNTAEFLCNVFYWDRGRIGTIWMDLHNLGNSALNSGRYSFPTPNIAVVVSELRLSRSSKRDPFHDLVIQIHLGIKGFRNPI